MRLPQIVAEREISMLESLTSESIAIRSLSVPNSSTLEVSGVSAGNTGTASDSGAFLPMQPKASPATRTATAKI